MCPFIHRRRKAQHANATYPPWLNNRNTVHTDRMEPKGEINPANRRTRSSEKSRHMRLKQHFADHTVASRPSRTAKGKSTNTLQARRAESYVHRLLTGRGAGKGRRGKSSGACTWTLRFFRRRALACVAKLAGPLGESMGGRAAAREGGEGGESGRRRRRSTLPAFICFIHPSNYSASRQAHNLSKTSNPELFVLLRFFLQHARYSFLRLQSQ
jgi:hypothetical protein